MEFLVLNGPPDQGPIRFNLDHLYWYSDAFLSLQGNVLEIAPGTSKALDKLLQERVGCSLLRVEAEPVKED